MFNIPVLFIIFNRPNTTRKVFEAIRKARPIKLYIAADGPRENVLSDIQKCNESRSIIDSIDWDCVVETKFQSNNIGCFKGPKSAIDWFFEYEDKGIILEDDCLPSQDFFAFCEELLNLYNDDERVINICGSNMGFNKNNPSGYFFSRFMNMSGWATWRRSVVNIDYKISSWEKSNRSLFKIYRLMRQNNLDFDISWYKYWKNKFDKTIRNKKISWWDWQWVYYQIENRKLSIIPNKNLVSNIGFNADATHTKDPLNPLADIPSQKMLFPLVHPRKIQPDFKYEEIAVKWTWCYHKRIPLISYLTARIKKLFALTWNQFFHS